MKMVSVAKCMGIMAGLGAVGGAGSSYWIQSKADKVALDHVSSQAKDGKIKIGGMKPDGTLWDGQISVDEFKNNLSKKRTISSAIMGLATAVGTSLVAGITLLLRGKVK